MNSHEDMKPRRGLGFSIAPPASAPGAVSADSDSRFSIFDYLPFPSFVASCLRVKLVHGKKGVGAIPAKEGTKGTDAWCAFLQDRARCRWKKT